TSMDAYADEVVGTLDGLDAKDADIAGMSMGGYVALAVLRRHPEKVRSLILIDTQPAGDPEEAKPGREKTAEKAQANGTIALEEDLFPKLFSPKTDDSVKERIREMMRNTPDDTAAQDALAMRDRVDSTTALSLAEVPVLVIHGKDDMLMPVEGAREWSSKVPGAEWVEIPDAGHVGPMENPEAVNQAIRNFLS
ncbi:MAG TPA: alpha/beta fold hydrolase, partial [Actinomycetota bacterium]|nr:alpha/beta fold hydrolase [Actinomycetota bacterium]